MIRKLLHQQFLSLHSFRTYLTRLCVGILLLLSLAVQPVSAAPVLDRVLEASTHQAESSYWIWLVLPRLFPEYLPDVGGYLSLGFSWIPGDETPIGITKIPAGRFKSSRQHLNCTSCHTQSSIGDSQEMPIKVTPFVHSEYASFLKACATDPRFSADYILPLIRYNHDLSLIDSIVYRWYLIPQARASFLDYAAKSSS